MFERFTPLARRAVRLAQAEAERLGHDTMGTEHLMLGLVATGEGYGPAVLAELGVTLDKARVALEEIRPHGPDAGVGRTPAFTRRLWSAARVALGETRARGGYRVGTEHLLLGVVEVDGRGAQVLEHLGYEREAVRAAVDDLLARPGPKRAVGGAGGEEPVRGWDEGDDQEEPTVPVPVSATSPSSEPALEPGLGPAAAAAERAQRPDPALTKPDEYLAALQAEGEALAAAAERGLHERVVSCPGWTVADLVWHTGEVHTFWRQVVEHRWQHPDDYVEPERPPWADLLAWFRAGLHDLLSTLAVAEPDVHVWTWSARRDAGWVMRRMAQETAVHRWDVEATVGDAAPIERHLAADGVDEFLEHFLPGARAGAPRIGGSVHLEAADVRGEWLVRARQHPPEVAREHGPADVTVRGAASDLLLTLWRRRSYEGLEVSGDVAVLLRLLAHADLD